MLRQALKTAMMVAAENGRLECVKVLLQAGADANAVDYVRASLRCARCPPGLTWPPLAPIAHLPVRS